MELSQAVDLMKLCVDKTSAGQVWLDLGAGSGLFTRALSLVLPKGSAVYAVDYQHTNPLPHPEVKVETVALDFKTGLGSLPNANGILMANSLHYVRDQKKMLHEVFQQLQKGGKLILIEYDTPTANRWVPYPLPFDHLQKLVPSTPFHSLTRIASVPSAYHPEGMYVAQLT
jgi:ubiquinone/menaquinone biosynthesis C-methylase UbiE